MANFAYTYDAADNMLTKVMPFEENFDDGTHSGWGAQGTWSAVNGVMENVVDLANTRFFVC